MAETKRVYVYRDAGLIDSYKVFPAVVILRGKEGADKKDKFELVNTLDDKEVSLTVPGDRFEGGKIEDVKIGPGQTYGPKTPKDRNSPIGVDYEVKVGATKAKGNSDPVIIIDP